MELLVGSDDGPKKITPEKISARLEMLKETNKLCSKIEDVFGWNRSPRAHNHNTQAADSAALSASGWARHLGSVKRAAVDLRGRMRRQPRGYSKEVYERLNSLLVSISSLSSEGVDLSLITDAEHTTGPPAPIGAGYTPLAWFPPGPIQLAVQVEDA